MMLSFLDRARCVAVSLGVAGFCGSAALLPCTASPVLTRDAASAMVLANGFRLVSRAELVAPRQDKGVPASGSWATAAASPRWDVWAVKDGIAYRITVDASTGDLLGAAPAVEDD